MKNKNNETQTIQLTVVPKLSDPALWDRIRDWHQTLSADKALAAKIAASGVLRGGDASPLILEYLRFAYLAWTSPEGATPSKSVDEAWHAHLLFTRSYDRFCEATRGERLHHDPGDGDADDAARFEAAYAATLARYEAEFGPSPDRWWPKPAPRPAEPTVQGSPARARAMSAPVAFLLGIAPVAGGALAWTQSGSFGIGLIAGGAAFVGSMVLSSAIEYENAPPETRAARDDRRRKDSGGSDGGGYVPGGGGEGCADGGTGSCGDGGGGSSCGGGGCGGGGCGGG